MDASCDKFRFKSKNIGYSTLFTFKAGQDFTLQQNFRVYRLINLSQKMVYCYHTVFPVASSCFDACFTLCLFHTRITEYLINLNAE